MAARSWLQENNHAYEERDLDIPGNFHRMIEATHLPPSALRLPIIGINGTYKTGFSPTELYERLEYAQNAERPQSLWRKLIWRIRHPF